MYNRYVPQADGSFRRSRMPEPAAVQRQEAPPQPRPAQQEAPPPQQIDPPPRQPYSPPPRNYPPTRPHSQYGHPAPSVGSFLKGLLPQNFDVEDLMVVLLLLLMSGNSGGDQNGALMTLVIYLFL